MGGMGGFLFLHVGLLIVTDRQALGSEEATKPGCPSRRTHCIKGQRQLSSGTGIGNNNTIPFPGQHRAQVWWGAVTWLGQSVHRPQESSYNDPL